jgi:hypothetical protein
LPKPQKGEKVMTKRIAIQLMAVAILMGLANMLPTAAQAQPRGNNTQCRIK